MIGQEFGMLVVICEFGRSPSGKRTWLCECQCGSLCTPIGGNLKSGVTNSCGCQVVRATRERNTKHGKCLSGAHRTWKAMRQRCLNPMAEKFPDYGGRGIRVCERWNSFENFLEDMGERPEGLSIDRIDVDGDYEPGNCRWATQVEQRSNQRRSTTLEES